MTRAKSKSKGGVIRKSILILNLFVVLFLALTYLTPHVAVEKWGWLTLLALSYPFIMLLNGCFVACWLIVRSWYWVFSLGILILGFPVHSMYFKLLPNSSKKNACEESIRVLSYNLRGLSMVPAETGSSTERRVESLFDAVSDLKEYPDIFSIQEGSRGEFIGQQFGLKHRVHGTKSTLWILSRYPISDHGEMQGEETNPYCIWADLKTDQGMLRVYNMHLMSNRVTNTTEELIQDMDFKKENTWNSIRFIMSRYKSTTRNRSKEAMALQKHIHNCPYPAIVTGDGNDPPLSHTYYVLSKGLKDSFREKGTGFSTTYESTLPLLRIDYLLGTPDIQFKDHTTHHLNYSDHYPVSTGICIKSGTSS